MRKRVAFSRQNLPLNDLLDHRQDIDAALILYFSAINPLFTHRFVGYSTSQVTLELELRRDEADFQFALTALSAVEAAFRIDYLQRCYSKKKDKLSREMRLLYNRKGERVSFEDEILEIWKENTIGLSATISELRSALRLRHWLAHGRYWVPKLGRKYDFLSIATLISEIFNSAQFIGAV